MTGDLYEVSKLQKTAMEEEQERKDDLQNIIQFLGKENSNIFQANINFLTFGVSELNFFQDTGINRIQYFNEQVHIFASIDDWYNRYKNTNDENVEFNVKVLSEKEMKKMIQENSKTENKINLLTNKKIYIERVRKILNRLDLIIEDPEKFQKVPEVWRDFAKINETKLKYMLGLIPKYIKNIEDTIQELRAEIPATDQ